jgi:hypothetical protein
MVCYVSYVAETKRMKKRILLGVLQDLRYTRTGNVTEIHADWKLVSAADKFLADPDQTRGDPAAPLVCMGNGGGSAFACICIVHKFDSLFSTGAVYIILPLATTNSN